MAMYRLPNNSPPARHDVRADVYKILSNNITPPTFNRSKLLLENGSYLLLEQSGRMILGS